MAERIVLTYDADTGPLQSALNEIPAATSAATAKADNALGKFTKTGVSATKQTKKVSASMRSLALQLPDVVSGFASGQAPMTIFIQQGLQVVQTNEKMIQGLARLGAKAFAPLAVLAVAGAFAYKKYNEEQKRVAELAEFSNAIVSTSITLTKKLTQATIALAIETGGLSELEGEILQIRQRNFQATLPSIQKITSRITAQAGEVVRLEQAVIAEEASQAAANKTALGSGSILAGTKVSAEKLTNTLVELNRQVDDARQKESDLNAQRTAQVDGLRELTKTNIETAKARNANASAARAHAKAMREEQEALDRIIAGLLLQEDAQRSVAQIASDAASDQLSARENLERAALEDFLELEKRAKDGADITEASFAVEARLEREMFALRAELGDESLARRIEREEKIRAEIETTAQQEIDAAVGTVSNISSALSDLAAIKAEKGQEGALEAFQAAKAAGVAEAGINTILAVSRALASAPPPISFALAASAGVAGAFQVAAIAAEPPPTFQSGGIVSGQMPPDHVQVGIRPDEGVLTSRGVNAAGGRDGLDSLNRGDTGGGSVIPVPVFRSSRRFFKDEIRSSGPLRSALRRGKKSGQRGF